MAALDVQQATPQAVAKQPLGSFSAKLLMSTNRLTRFSKYSLVLQLTQKFRFTLGLSSVSAISAVVNAKCLCVLTKHVARCSKCRPDKRLMEVVFAHATSTRDNLNACVEEYHFVVFSFCSSSRDHLHSPVVLSVSLSPGCADVVTAPFVLLARAGSPSNVRTRRREITACINRHPPLPPPCIPSNNGPAERLSAQSLEDKQAACSVAPTGSPVTPKCPASPVTPPSTLPELAQRKRVKQQGNNAVKEVKEEPLSPPPDDVDCTPPLVSPPIGPVSPRCFKQEEGQGCQHSLLTIAAQLESYPRNFFFAKPSVVVRVVNFSLPREQLRILQEASYAFLKTLPGFTMQLTNVLTDSLFVNVFTWSNQNCAEVGYRRLLQYDQNLDVVANPLSCDCFLSGVYSLVAECTNYC
eukprot:TRINITY_DN3902_c0_g1_i2.p1 TRINITY_DN3902_c0_g1~~TRINITY_DN3902_c0_g1_i2.p1  ORF type:complete len:422 (-),score=76.02 TRINITY_DN3902_c0_g1_i2:112-1341(-)